MELLGRIKHTGVGRHSAELARGGHREHRADGAVVFGVEIVIDLDGCDRRAISDPSSLESFAIGLTDLIGAARVFDPMLQRVENADPIIAGYRLFQLTHIATMTGVFSDMLDRAHLNLFSCADIDAAAVVPYCREFFRAEQVTSTKLIR